MLQRLHLEIRAIVGSTRSALGKTSGEQERGRIRAIAGDMLRALGARVVAQQDELLRRRYQDAVQEFRTADPSQASAAADALPEHDEGSHATP